MKTNLRLIFASLALIAVLSSVSASAQDTAAVNDDQAPVVRVHRNQLSLNFVEPGIGSVAYKGSYDWENPLGTTVGIGLTYTHWFTRHIGINTGLNFSYMYHTEMLKNIPSSCDGSVELLGPDGYEVKKAHFEIMTPEVNEHQAIFMLEVPLQIAFQGNNHLFGNIGVSFATPITTFGSYSYDGSEYLITAVTGLDVDFSDCPINAVVVDGNEGTYFPADIKRPFFYTLSCDLGWKFNFDRANSLALSLYCNYSLNTCKLDDTSFDLVDIAADKTTAKPPLATGLVNEYRYFNAGVRVAYHIGIGKKMIE